MDYKSDLEQKRDTPARTSSRSSRGFRNKDTSGNSFYPRIFGKRGAIATEHYLSAEAGIEILKQGGNAVDAAVAATFVEGVVNQQMHSIGGEVTILIGVPGTDHPVAINGNMVAPRRATPSAFLDRGFEKIPPEGVLAAGVPGAMAALIEALIRFGSMNFADIARPAIDLARTGFPVHSGLLRQHKYGISANVEKFASQWPGSMALYCPEGRMPFEGELLRNPALAGMYDYLAGAETSAGGTRERGLRAAADAFYKGEVAGEIVKFVAAHDGLLELTDLEGFKARVEPAVRLDFSGVELYKCGPWTQGPALLQTLSILKNRDLRALGHNSQEYIHVVAEALKLAFADRDQFYGDPSFIDVPLTDLLSDEYGSLRAALIGDDANAALRPGDPRRMQALLPDHERWESQPWGPGTVNVNVVDASGLAAAFTPSGAWIMQSEVVPALGFPLGSRLSNCLLAPDNHPNVVAPLRQPRTTISPSLAMKEGKPWLAFGSMGGDQQDQWQLQFFLNRVVFDMPIQRAIEAPKFSSEHFPGFFYPHDSFRNRLRIEETVGEKAIKALAARGHDVDIAPSWTEGYLCAVERDVVSGMLEAGADPRGAKAEIFPACTLAF